MKDPRVVRLEELYMTGDPDVQVMIRAIIEREGKALGDMDPETLDDLIEMCDTLIEELPQNEKFVLPGMPGPPDPQDPRPFWPNMPCRCVDRVPPYGGCKAHSSMVKVVDPQDPTTWVEVFPDVGEDHETPVQPLPPPVA